MKDVRNIRVLLVVLALGSTMTACAPLSVFAPLTGAHPGQGWQLHYTKTAAPGQPPSKIYVVLARQRIRYEDLDTGELIILTETDRIICGAARTNCIRNPIVSSPRNPIAESSIAKNALGHQFIIEQVADPWGPKSIMMAFLAENKAAAPARTIAGIDSECVSGSTAGFPGSEITVCRAIDGHFLTQGPGPDHPLELQRAVHSYSDSDFEPPPGTRYHN